MRIDKNTTIRLGDRNIVKVKLGDVVIWQKEPDYFYVENTYDGGNTISVKQTLTGSPDSSLYAKTLQYSKDKTNWSTITLSSTAYTITLNKGEKVYFRGNEGVLNYYVLGTSAITNISGTQSHIVSGNINTLINYMTPNELTLTQGVFARLFRNNKTITSAENLTLPPSMDGSLSNYSYESMFEECSKLITAPKSIPATTQGISSCKSMFKSCIKLVTPPELRSLNLTDSCYSGIFWLCTSLQTAPQLPAETLAPNCYENAFTSCSKLTTPPVLPAKILARRCYYALFNGCTSLNNLTVYADDISADSCISEWLRDVAAKGTFRNLGSATYGRGTSGIPSGWTEVKPTWSWNVVTDGTYPFELNSNGYYESTNKGQSSSYSYATLNYSGFNELVLECINSGEPSWDYGIISQPDVELSKSYENDGETGSPIVFHTFREEHSTNPVQITIPSDGGSHFITIKYKKDGGVDNGNDSFQFKVIEP